MKDYLKGLIQNSSEEIMNKQYLIIENLNSDRLEKIYKFIKALENEHDKTFTIRDFSFYGENPFISINLSLNLI